MAHHVHRVARRAPDGRLVNRGADRHVVLELDALDLLVVVEHAVEGAVEAVVDVLELLCAFEPLLLVLFIVVTVPDPESSVSLALFFLLL